MRQRSPATEKRAFELFAEKQRLRIVKQLSQRRRRRRRQQSDEDVEQRGMRYSELSDAPDTLTIRR